MTTRSCLELTVVYGALLGILGGVMMVLFSNNQSHSTSAAAAEIRVFGGVPDAKQQPTRVRT